MSSKRTVVVINQYAFPREYGGITRNFDMFSRLDKWHFQILTTSRNHYSGAIMKVNDQRFSMLWVPNYRGNGLMRLVGWGIFAVQATLKGLFCKSDIVFGSTPHLLAPLSALVVSRIRRKPFVLEVRDLWPESIVTAGALTEGTVTHRILVRLERMLYRRASQIVVVTAGWEEHFESLGIDPRKITVISNGADLTDYEVAESRETLRARYGINGFTAVFTGNHSPYVGLETIVESADCLPDMKFLLVGSGSRKQWAIDEVARRCLTNVAFMEPIGKSELPSLLKACDVGLHTIAPQSVFDKGMSPNKLFDYMASGLPSVSNARIPLRNVISDDQVGAVTEPKDLVEGLIRVRDADEATRRRWTAEGLTLMQEKFSLNSAAKKLEIVLERASKN